MLAGCGDWSSSARAWLASVGWPAWYGGNGQRVTIQAIGSGSRPVSQRATAISRPWPKKGWRRSPTDRPGSGRAGKEPRRSCWASWRSCDAMPQARASATAVRDGRRARGAAVPAGIHDQWPAFRCHPQCRRSVAGDGVGVACDGRAGTSADPPNVRFRRRVGSKGAQPTRHGETLAALLALRGKNVSVSQGMQVTTRLCQIGDDRIKPPAPHAGR
jgi:hypothetical protein